MSAFDDLQRQLSKSVGDRASADQAAATTDAATDHDRGRTSRRRTRGAHATDGTTARPRRWWTTRPFALALVGLTVAGSATAATVAFRGQPSAPLEGRLGPVLPGASPKTQRGFDRYRVSFSPLLAVGETGWCLSTTRFGPRGQSFGTGDCGSDGASKDPVIASDLGSSFTLTPGGPPENTTSLVVDDRIGGLRTADGRTFTPRSDPSLPFGWRIIVVPRPGKGDPVVLDTEGRRSKAYYDRPPVEMTLSNVLDRVKLPKDDPYGDDYDGFVAPPQPVAWTIRTTSRDVRIGKEREVDELPAPTRGLRGRPLFGASDARIAYGGRQYRALYLVDAANPNAAAGVFPGARPGPAPGLFAVPGDSANRPMTIRRSGPGWLVVQGPSPAGRTAVLAALRAG